MKNSQSELKSILFILGASVVSAFLIAFLLIYFYGPSSTYLAGDTLLNPEIINQVNRREMGKRERTPQFVFEKMTFSFLDQKLGKIAQRPVSLNQYDTFYAMVAHEKSLSIPEAIQEAFDKRSPILVTTQMRTAGKTIEAGQVFQEVQFVEEDFFRVQLKTSGSQAEWAYYYRPHLYAEVMNLFNPATEL